MPVTIAKTDHKYRVSTPGGTKAKGTSLRKAMAQKRLLQAIEHNPDWHPTGQPSNLKKMAFAKRATKKRK